MVCMSQSIHVTRRGYPQSWDTAAHAREMVYHSQEPIPQV